MATHELSIRILNHFKAILASFRFQVALTGRNRRGGINLNLALTAFHTFSHESETEMVL